MLHDDDLAAVENRLADVARGAEATLALANDALNRLNVAEKKLRQLEVNVAEIQNDLAAPPS